MDKNLLSEMKKMNFKNLKFNFRDYSIYYLVSFWLFLFLVIDILRNIIHYSFWNYGFTAFIWIFYKVLYFSPFNLDFSIMFFLLNLFINGIFYYSLCFLIKKYILSKNSSIFFRRFFITCLVIGFLILCFGGLVNMATPKLGYK